MRMIRMTVHRSLARAQNDRTTTRITHKPILAELGRGKVKTGDNCSSPVLTFSRPDYLPPGLGGCLHNKIKGVKWKNK